MPSSLKKAEQLILSSQGKRLSREIRVVKTIELTSLLLEAALHEKTHRDIKRDLWRGRMMGDPQGRVFMTTMTDQVFRSHSSERTADQLRYLLHTFGIPRFLNVQDQMSFFLFARLGTRFPSLFIPLIRKKIRQEMAGVLLPENRAKQAAYFHKCWKENIRINLNHLGEAILGEQECEKRLVIYLSDLANPLIEYVSIKISTLYSQIERVSFSQTLEILADRLRLLYRMAQENQFKRANGTVVTKFVNLDMEEYRDLDLTVALFKKVLSEPEFLSLQAGIVLQSYLPDAFAVQKSLTEWAMERRRQGGSPIKIRLVKGANFAMEAVESSLRNWDQATFTAKSDSDANFKKMLEFGCTQKNAEAVHLGVGSHNLFDIAYALLLRAEGELENSVSFEMLEGMAKPMRSVIKKLSGGMLLYCPETKEKNFHNAVAYLIRRLDENSGPENFLRSFFFMRPANKEWESQAYRFIESCKRIDHLPEEANRRQDRLKPPSKPAMCSPFVNEPDTDFSLKQNRQWADEIFSTWETKKHRGIPLVLAGEEITTLLEPGRDPSRPTIPLYQYSLADVPLIERALNAAVESEKTWGELPFSERSALLGQVAHEFRHRRGDLIGAMIADGGKTVSEADPEVSEAIDFLEYYRKTWEEELKREEFTWRPKGTVLVTPPWNFPCSIPVSGIAAALTAGNCVLFKPAPEAVLVGWYIVQAFWAGGIPKEVLQFINCKEEPVGNYLIKHPKVSSVILTGATQTARKFLKLRPGLDLHAETGGKNAIIVSAMSDRDLAVRDIISSAFGHSGQKCSACSLAIVEAEVYDDPDFKNQLFDAASSLKVASAWDKSARVTPLIRPPEGALLRGLTQLEEGETWLLEPKPHPENAHLWSPGIKWGVREGSFTHQTELFGPLLGVMRAENLHEALRFTNGTPYGLTSGLHSLDEREHEEWKKHIVAGNLYINRGITGAIVRRQPFGGCKASSFGSGAKAGGPNYVHPFAIPTQLSLPSDPAPLPATLIPLFSILSALTEHEQQMWKKSAESYVYWAERLKRPTDPSPVLGEDNFFYHIPLEKTTLRLDKPEITLPLLQVMAACLSCQTPLEISSSAPLPHIPSVLVEDEQTLVSRSQPRIRLLAPPSPFLKQSAAEQGILLNGEPVLASGRFELLHYLREISLSVDYHRYGYLGLRSLT